MTSLRHLRSDTANKRPDPTALSTGQVAINYESSSPGLFFKDSAGNLVKAGPVHIGTAAPNATPAAGGSTGNAVGEFWLDTTGGAYNLKVWDGSAWRSAAGEYVNVTGDTMTGNLTLDNCNLVFEGSTADSFETTLTVVDPTADNTITLPNVSGTVVTTGDTGTVTSAMIANATIVDADISASAEIAVSKLADGAARQLLQTDAAGTGVEWTSNVDVPGTLDVTGAAVFDSTANIAGNLTVDTNTLFVDATNNRVGVGTTTMPADTNLTVLGNYQSGFYRNVSSGGRAYVINIGATSPSGFIDGASITGGLATGDANGSISFGTRTSGTVTEKFRCDEAGRLLVGTSSSLGNGIAQFRANTDSSTGEGTILLAKGDAATAGQSLGQIKFVNSSGNQAAWVTGEADTGWGGAGSADYPGRLVFSTTADGASSPTERMRITSGGRFAFGGQGAPYAASTCDSYNNASGEFAHAFRQDHASGFGLGVGVDGIGLVYFYPNSGLSGAPVGTITQNGSATAYNTSSDYRLKENVTNVTDGITRLQQLKPSRFNFIADPAKTVDGFIAHEVQSVVPEAITGEKDAVDADGNPVYQGIDQSKLVPLLTAALQEAVAKIEALEARLTALESA